MNKCFVALGLALGMAVLPARAATSTYMHVPGIPGEATEFRHPGWIELSSVTQSLVGRASNPQCTLTVTKHLDIAGPRLWMAAVTGQNLGQVQIDLIAPVREAAATYYRIVLNNARITTISTAGSGSAPTEQLSISTSSVTLSYWPQLADGSLGAPVTQTFSC
jgi:type VI secretion system secreted protein Hcp